MQSRSEIVLAAVLALFKPLARLLLRSGVAYPAFSAALKQVFLQAAVEELQSAGKKQTDSAISLLSGVHRRDVRNLGRPEGIQLTATGGPMNMASEVVTRWLSEVEYLDGEGRPLELARGGGAPSFDALVASISSDIRPRAVLDEVIRLGMVQESDGRVRLLAPGFVPRRGFAEMAALMRDSLHDHAAAASLNLEGGHNYLEQSIFVDELSPESAEHLHAVSARAWRQAFKTVMREAHARYRHDQSHATAQQRMRRVRFGTYFYAADENDKPA